MADPYGRPAVVIDNGTGYTKMGYAGNVEPQYIVPTVAGFKRSQVKLCTVQSRHCTALHNTPIISVHRVAVTYFLLNVIVTCSNSVAVPYFRL